MAECSRDKFLELQIEWKERGVSPGQGVGGCEGEDRAKEDREESFSPEGDAPGMARWAEDGTDDSRMGPCEGHAYRLNSSVIVMADNSSFL